ncbi:MAG: PBP1A family penicillin-binding protein, partial [Clostridia bacterium]
KIKTKKINKDIINKPTKEEKINKKDSNKKYKVFKIILFILIAMFIIGTGIVIGIISGVIDKTDSIKEEDLKLLKLTSFIYDKDGNEIGSLYDIENRVTTQYKNMPKHLIDAIVSIEDERFFKHNGVDVKRTLGAAFTYIINGGKSNFGGSTITQQLVKNIQKDSEASIPRKIREWYRAISLETKLSKEEILEAYLNTIYLGDGTWGVEIASQNYFGKSVKDITLEESAILAAIIQTPESTNPYKSDEQKEKLLNRQKLVLSQMLKLNKIDKETYEKAIKTEVAFKKEKVDVGTGVQTYFVDAVISQVKKDLMEQSNISKGVAEKRLYSDGLKIYSTQDKNIQQAINDAYKNEKIFYKDKKGDFMQSSMVVMDHSTGNVLGLIGGAGEKTGMDFNRATDAYRQPGSTMKPLGAYGPAFEQGVLAPGMGLDDSQFVMGNWTVKNYYGYYNGYVTARDAIAKSMNVPAVRACQKAGADYAYKFARNAGLVDLQEKDKNLASLALGGVTKGFTVMEMANAYSTIANGGIYIKPKLYSKVVDKDGKEILKNSIEPKSVMKDTTAYMLTDCLAGVVKPGGTAYGYVKTGNMPLAGKTGQTDEDKDQWFIGFSPYYTIACWNGYDDPKPIGRGYPYSSVKLFNTVMNSITKGQPIKQFNRPSGIVNGSVCRVSGGVVTDACRLDPRGDQTITDIFASGSISKTTCSVHKRAEICKETGLLATEYCPKELRTFITRDYDLNASASDAKYMIPKDTCKVHTKKINDDINIYGIKPKE